MKGKLLGWKFTKEADVQKQAFVREQVNVRKRQDTVEVRIRSVGRVKP